MKHTDYTKKPMTQKAFARAVKESRKQVHAKILTGYCDVCGHYGEDCLGVESKPRPELTPVQWEEIYYALDTKRGMYSEFQDPESRRWVIDLTEIMQIIGPDGENMRGKK